MDKNLLFKPRLPEAEVDIPGVGTVRVRGLNRMEAMLLEKVDDTDAKERRILRFGMVDPVLTEAEAGRWQKAAIVGELQQVIQTIVELSGMLPEAQKEAYKSLRDESSNGVRLLLGSEAGDGGGSVEDGIE